LSGGRLWTRYRRKSLNRPDGQIIGANRQCTVKSAPQTNTVYLRRGAACGAARTAIVSVTDPGPGPAANQDPDILDHDTLVIDENEVGGSARE
jgi:hypothetical protein